MASAAVNLDGLLNTLKRDMDQDYDFVHHLVGGELRWDNLSSSALSLCRYEREIKRYEDLLRKASSDNSSAFAAASEQCWKLKNEVKIFREKYYTLIDGPAPRTDAVIAKFAVFESFLVRVERIFRACKGPIPLNVCIHVMASMNEARAKIAQIGEHDEVSKRLVFVLSQATASLSIYSDPPIVISEEE